MDKAEATRILRNIRAVYASGIAIPCAGAVSALDVAIEAMEANNIKKENSTDELKFQLSEWISVKDRLPDISGYYLCKVCAFVRPIRIMGYQPRDTMWFKDRNQWYVDTDHGEDYAYNWFVEYWMPLPEPPKEEQI